jgi:hypothetical protein
MALIYRVSETTISVDDIDCELESDGRYYPIMAEITNVSLFPDAIDAFLEMEKEWFLEEWGVTVESLLEKLNIDYGKN